MSTKLKLFHYSGSKIKKIQQMAHYSWDEKLVPHTSGKPFGFWVSVGSAWADWCRDEGFRLCELKYQYQVYLRKNHNVLIIDNLTAFDGFCIEYGWDKYNYNDFLREEEIAFREKCSDRMKDAFGPYSGVYNTEVHWDKVKARYQGIIISPYFYERTLAYHSQWYYGWDCDSGVIWDVSCIRDFRLNRRKTIHKNKE